MPKKPIRILHVVGGMNRGGAETWLMHVLRHIDRQQFHMDFLVHADKPCAYDEEIRDLGSQVIPCPRPSEPLQYRSHFFHALSTYGPYDVIHSHVHHYSGYVLSLARRVNIPIRIAHCHSDRTPSEAHARLMRRLYLAITARWIQRCATHGLACSEAAAENLFGLRWTTDPRWKVLYCSIDPAPFRQPVDVAATRAELGIAPDAFVIGHVGRFDTPKNHTFLLDIAAEVIRRFPRAHFLLVGDGPLRSAMEQKAHALRLDHHVSFAGLRADIPRLMRAAMDFFVFPSLYEGLPVTLIEAQAASLPYLASDVITPEVDWVAGLGRRLGLTQSAEQWADEVLAAKATGAPTLVADNLSMIEQSPFNIHVGIKQLERIYAGHAS